MVKKCGTCKNLKPLKENGRHVLVCEITNHIHNVIDTVLCRHYQKKNN